MNDFVVFGFHDHVDFVRGRGEWRGRYNGSGSGWTWPGDSRTRPVLGHCWLGGGELVIRIVIQRGTGRNGITPLSVGQARNLGGPIDLKSSGAQNVCLGSERGSIGGQYLGILHRSREGVALDQLATWWRPVPALVNIASQHGTTQHLIALVTLVDDGAQVSDGSINQVVRSLRNRGRQSALDEFAHRGEFVVESGVQASPRGRSNQQVTLIARIVDGSSDIKTVRGDHG